jgi:hypothetical protein
VNDHVVRGGTGGNCVNRDRAAEWIDGGNVARAAIRGERGIVDLNRLIVIHEDRTRRLGHRERGGRDRVDRAEHAVAIGLHHFVEEGAKLRHRVFHFTLGGVLDRFLGRVRGVLDELGDFYGVAEKYGRHLRDVVDRAGTAAQIASGTNLQREAHVARADAFDIAALLDHGEQDVVAFVEERKFVADFFELQCDGLRILHLCHGGVSVVGFELAQASA